MRASPFLACPPRGAQQAATFRVQADGFSPEPSKLR